jgi:hypothetical protein
MRGTALAVNGEWTKLSNDERNKTPFVWMVKPIVEEYFGEKSNIERLSDLRLYFLDSTNVSYTESEINDNVLKPLWAWVDAFIEVIKKDRGFDYVKSYSTRELNRFGTETAQGFEANIIDSNLSAIEVRFTLPIKKSNSCLCSPKVREDFLIWDGESAIDLGNNNILEYE